MSNLEQIFETWSMKQKDSAEIRAMLDRLRICLGTSCPPETMETLSSCIGDCCRLVERQAFLAGFCEAAELWQEIQRLKGRELS